jgi:hypothetical protein
MKLPLPWLLPVAAFIAGWVFSTPRAVSPVLAGPAPVSVGVTKEVAATKPSPEPAPVARVIDRQSPPELAQVPLVSLPEALSYPSILRRLAAFARLVDSLDASGLAGLHRELAATPDVPWNLWHYFFRRWAQLAPEAAARACLAHRHGEAAPLSDIFGVWGISDPKAALAWLDAQQLAPTEELNRVRSRLLDAFSPKPGQASPAETVQQILALGTPQDDNLSLPSRRLKDAMLDWARKDSGAAWQGALAIDSSEPRRQTALAAVVAVLAATDRIRCHQMIERLTDPAERASLTGVLANNLAWKVGVPAARDFALGLPSGDARRAALGEVAWTMQRKEPPAFAAFMTSLSAADFQDPTPYRQALSEWFTRQPAQAADFLLARLPPDFQPNESQAAAFQQIFGSWGLHSAQPKKEIAEILLKLPASLRGPPLEGTIQQLVASNAAAAAQWAADFPHDGNRAILIESVARQWSQRTPAEATQWLNTLPPGATRAAAIEGFAGSMMSTNPDDALAWLRSIPSETDRLPRLRHAWSKWLDRPSALHWRDTSPTLTPAERAALTEP